MVDLKGQLELKVNENQKLEETKESLSASNAELNKTLENLNQKLKEVCVFSVVGNLAAVGFLILVTRMFVRMTVLICCSRQNYDFHWSQGTCRLRWKNSSGMRSLLRKNWLLFTRYGVLWWSCLVFWKTIDWFRCSFVIRDLHWLFKSNDTIYVCRNLLTLQRKK